MSAIATIHEYRQVSPRLALITASVSALHAGANKEDVYFALKEAAGEGLQPVRGSFRWIDSGSRDAVSGYVFASTPIVSLEGDAAPEGFQRVTANLFMNKSDEELWEVKGTTGGSKYLARKGQVDLSSLLDTVRSSARGNAPRLSHITASVEADPNEAVTYVLETARTAEVDTGICIEKGENGAMVVLSSLDPKKPHARRVEASHVIQVNQLTAHPKPLPRERVSAAIQARTPAQRQNSGAMDKVLTPAEYWTLQYSYDQEYLQKVLQLVAEMAAA